ncbi:MAG: hypothetical protein LUE91_02440 [Oscillospiraceae bacterium]|nr:hypothetical protein [Oscillospiraceae bacterium]
MNNKTKDPEFVGTWGLVAICVAFTITLNNFAVGAGVMAGMTFWKGIAAIVVAWILLSLTWMFSGQIGAMTKKPAAEIFKNVFGKQGFRIPSLMMSLACTGFGIFDFWFVGSAFANTFPGNKNVAFIIGILVIVAIAIIGNLKNVTSIKLADHPDHSNRSGAVYRHHGGHHREGGGHGRDHGLCANKQYALLCRGQRAVCQLYRHRLRLF